MNCYFLSCFFFSHLSTVTFFPVTFFLLVHCYFLSCYFFSYLKLLLSFLLPFFLLLSFRAPCLHRVWDCEFLLLISHVLPTIITKSRLCLHCVRGCELVSLMCNVCLGSQKAACVCTMWESASLHHKRVMVGQNHRSHTRSTPCERPGACHTWPESLKSNLHDDVIKWKHFPR